MKKDSILSSLGISGHTAIARNERKVVRRDGSIEEFALNKVTRAIALAFYDFRNAGATNPCRDEYLSCYGLNDEDFGMALQITESVDKALEIYYRSGKTPTVEQIQDLAEKQIAAAGCWDVAREFIVYRTRHASMRLTKYEHNGLADYIAATKYCRYDAALGRREVFSEAVQRVASMHKTFFAAKLDLRFPAHLPADIATLAGDAAPVVERLLGGKSLEEVIDQVFGSVKQFKILPSMRSLQFGGNATLRNHARMFNCAASPADRLKFFPEYLFLLLSGTGCGFSVQKHHVGLLPPLPSRGRKLDMPVWHYEVVDKIEGWADAIDSLFKAHYEGKNIEFSYSKIRARGTPLKTSGGKAPGHVPLKEAIIKVEHILDSAAGRHLAPIEVYDICMHLSAAVLSGGIRRSATICLFSPEDDEMMRAKTGDWFSKNPQRSASNNSAVIARKSADATLFRRLFETQKEYGEPGFFFCDDPDGMTNPCCEIGLHPVINENFHPDSEELKLLTAEGFENDLFNHKRISGWQMCNLTTINGAIATTEEIFLEGCVEAAVIGTFQAAYSKIPYVSKVTQVINEHDALIGVSICGIMDSPNVLTGEVSLKHGARAVRAANAWVADLINIRRAKRTTCVKPEGTASLLLGAGSGIHPHHARNYFRRVQANRKDSVYQFVRGINPQMTEISHYNPDADDVITFPVSVSRDAILRDDIGALDFLRIVRRVQQFWVLTGADPEHRSPGINHNVSNTCTVKPEEWKEVSDYIWDHREFFTGISLLAYEGDKAYPQSPRESVTTEEDIQKWNRLAPKKVDYSCMLETTDSTNLREIIACAGGRCDVA